MQPSGGIFGQHTVGAYHNFFQFFPFLSWTFHGGTSPLFLRRKSGKKNFNALWGLVIDRDLCPVTLCCVSRFSFSSAILAEVVFLYLGSSRRKNGRSKARRF
jgi:hypothetical protein